MVEEETVDGTVATVYEAGREALEVESCYSRLLSISSADELYEGVCVVGVEVYDLVRRLVRV